MPAEKKSVKSRKPRPEPALAPRAERAIGVLSALAGLNRKELTAVLRVAGGNPASPVAFAEFNLAVNLWVEQDPARLVRAIRKPVSNPQMRREWTKGPRPMQGIMQVRLRDGRRVGVSAFRADCSYDPEIQWFIPDRLSHLVDDCKQRSLESIRKQWGERRTHVVEPELVPMDGPGSPGRLPDVVCAAWLDSAPLGPDAMGSGLVVVWWQESLRGSVPRMVLNVIRDLNWNSLAEDFNL